MSEETGNKGKWNSGKRTWQINKKATHQGVIADFDKRTLSYDGQRYWIRFETQQKLYIYSIIEGTKA
jgi:hypothetical protein